MYAIWAVGAAIIFLASFIYMAWVDGQGEYIEHDQWIFSAAMIAAFWPIIVVIIIAVAPFFGLYRLVRKISSMKCGSQEPK